MANPAPKRTRSVLERGLKNHLEATRDQHNGYGYDDFIGMRERKVNRVNMARVFGVNRKTIDAWIKVYDEENIDG